MLTVRVYYDGLPKPSLETLLVTVAGREPDMIDENPDEFGFFWEFYDDNTAEVEAESLANAFKALNRSDLDISVG